MKDQVDALAPIGARARFDEVDQAVQQWPGVIARFAIGGCDLGDLVDLAAVVFDDRGMRDHRFDFGKVDQLCDQRVAASGQIVGARLQLVRRDPGDDRIGDAFFGLVDFGQLAIDVGAPGDQAAPFLGPCQAEFVEIGGDDFGMQKIAADRRPDPPLQNCVGYRRPVAAGSRLAIIRTAPAVGRNDDDRPAATSTAQLARKQAGLALALAAIAARIVQPLLNLGPGRVIDDLQFGNRPADLFACVIDPRNPLARVWVFPEGLAVIDYLPQI